MNIASYREINHLMVATNSSNLVPVLSRGHQALTGVFPKSADESVTVGPLELVWCPDSGLLQLKHTYESSEMYGDNYGYRSGLNQSMVDHLTSKIRYLERLIPLTTGDVVLDIGSNDRSEEHTSELQSLMRISYAVFCLTKTTTLVKHYDIAY